MRSEFAAVAASGVGCTGLRATASPRRRDRPTDPEHMPPSRRPITKGAGWASRTALASTSARCSTCPASTTLRSSTSMSRTRPSVSSGGTRRAATTARTARGTSSPPRPRDRRLQSADRARVRHRLERGPRQLAAKLRHARERATPLPRGVRERVRAVRPARARARSAAAGVKPGITARRPRPGSLADVANQADAPVSEAGGATHGGSTPSIRTRISSRRRRRDRPPDHRRLLSNRQSAPPRIPVRDRGQTRRAAASAAARRSCSSGSATTTSARAARAAVPAMLPQRRPLRRRRTGGLRPGALSPVRPAGRCDARPASSSSRRRTGDAGTGRDPRGNRVSPYCCVSSYARARFRPGRVRGSEPPGSRAGSASASR